MPGTHAPDPQSVEAPSLPSALHAMLEVPRQIDATPGVQADGVFVSGLPPVPESCGAPLRGVEHAAIEDKPRTTKAEATSDRMKDLREADESGGSQPPRRVEDDTALARAHHGTGPDDDALERDPG